jgi:hypothetical protein
MPFQRPEAVIYICLVGQHGRLSVRTELKRRLFTGHVNVEERLYRLRYSRVQWGVATEFRP